MPSSTFNNLTKEKKIKIMHAATKEFSTYTLMDASINRIIKEAGISRGSFYLYFKNIYEIYDYVLDVYIEKMETVFLEYLEINNGNLFLSIVDIFDYIIETGSKRANKDLCVNIFKNITMKNVIDFMDKNEEFIKKVLDRIKQIENKNTLLQMLYMELILSITKVLVKNKNKDKVKEELLFTLERINQGFK